jgi:hypothetical protein
MNAPLAGQPGGGTIGAITLRGPIGIKGWACDLGTDSPVTVELEMQEEARGVTHRELHAAVLPGGEMLRKTCGGKSDAHAFAVRPVTVPPGNYRTRVRVWNASGKRATLLGDDVRLEMEM